MQPAAKEEPFLLPMVWTGESVPPLAADLASLENLFPEKSELAENSHQGVATKNTAVVSTWSGANSQTALRDSGNVGGKPRRVPLFYKFTGNERDSETGLDHTDNRQYSPNTGRWLAADPGKGNAKNPQSWNRYSYGNPTNLRDLDGADPCNPDDADYNPDLCSFEFGDAGGFTQTSASPAPSCKNVFSPPTRTEYTCVHQSGSDWNQLVSDLDTIESKLNSDPNSKCDQLLTSAGTSLSTIDSVLSDPKDFYTLANAIYGPAGPLHGTTNDPGADVPTAFMLEDFQFAPGSQRDAELTILHEMAHYTHVFGYDSVNGNPSSGQNDRSKYQKGL